MNKKKSDQTPNAADTQRPNILMIVVHDLGTRLGCYGYDSIVSPHLVAFAADGVRFDKNFSTAPSCSPSRGAIITGKYPHVNGLMHNVNLGWNWDPAIRHWQRLLAAPAMRHFFSAISMRLARIVSKIWVFKT